MVNKVDLSNFKCGIAIVVSESILVGLYFLIMALMQLGINHIVIVLSLIDGRAVPFPVIISGLLGYLGIIWVLTFRGWKTRYPEPIKVSLTGAAVAFSYFVVVFMGISFFKTVLGPTVISALLIISVTLIILKLQKSNWQLFPGNLWGVLALVIFITRSYLGS